MILGVMWMMTAVVVGFMLGRASMYSMYGLLEPLEETAEEGAAEAKEVRAFLRRGRGHRGEEEGDSWSVGSPVSGTVTAQWEGERPTVAIYPDGDRLYAPAAGKVTRLFPMGNAFLLATEFGTELYIQAGEAGDELLARHYRPRILQNEVVGKGKLLLEFDRQGLEADGASPEVSVRVEHCAYGGSIKMTAGERVRIGEEVLQVREPAAQGARVFA